MIPLAGGILAQLLEGSPDLRWARDSPHEVIDQFGRPCAGDRLAAEHAATLHLLRIGRVFAHDVQEELICMFWLHLGDRRDDAHAFSCALASSRRRASAASATS